MRTVHINLVEKRSGQDWNHNCFHGLLRRGKKVLEYLGLWYNWRQVFAVEMGLEDFWGSSTWCYCFMQRHDLVVCQQTCLSQKLPKEYDDKILAFQRSVNVGYWISGQNTYDFWHAISLHYWSTGEEKCSSKNIRSRKDCFTVALICLGDGTTETPGDF